jgi:hypothetical protein
MMSSSQLSSRVPESDPFVFSRSSPIRSPTPSNILERIGSEAQYFKWSIKVHDDFIKWWISTPWVIEASQGDSGNIQRKIGWNSHIRKSPAWAPYYQAANASTGMPIVICQTCFIALQHPNIKSSGTSSLSKHTKSVQCQKSRKSQVPGLRHHQQTLEMSLSQPVSVVCQG